MPTGYTSITASNIQNCAGTKLVSGKMICTPVLNNRRRTSFKVGGPGGQVVASDVVFTIANGVLQSGAQLADTSLTNPVNIGYRIAITDDAMGGIEVQGPGYECVQPTGSSFNFDNYIPNLTPQLSVLVGPPGANGTGIGGGGFTLMDTVTGITYTVSIVDGTLTLT